MSSTNSKPSAVLNVVGIDQYLKLVEGEKRVIVIDFSATWCGPCKKLAPYLDQLSLQYANDLLIIKIDSDKDGELVEEQQLAPLFKVSPLPTIVFVKNCQYVDDPDFRIEGFNLKKLGNCLATLTGKTIVL